MKCADVAVTDLLNGKSQVVWYKYWKREAIRKEATKLVQELDSAPIDATADVKCICKSSHK